MTLRSFLEDVGPPNHAIAVVGGETVGPLEGMLAETFAESSIEVVPDVDARSDADPGGNAAVAIENEDAIDDDERVAVLLEDGRPVASSSLTELYETVLAINSDLFTTGARGLGDIRLPDVVATLADTRLRLRGYPLAHKEKLLLILLSRYIEQAAWRASAGTIRSSFQRLSRLEDEVGTRKVYERLAETDLDVHVYGATSRAIRGVDADAGERADHPIDLEVAVHTGTADEYRDAWFVVHRPPEPTASDATPAALVCLEREPRIWDGFWTFDPERVVAIDEYVATEL